MTAASRIIHAIIALLLGIVLAGCAPTRPPPDLLGNAMRSLEDAQLAEARTYAPLELRFATERYEQAQSAMNATDYAVANSELAIVKSRLGKSREAVDALKIQNEELRRNLDSVVEENQS